MFTHVAGLILAGVTWLSSVSQAQPSPDALYQQAHQLYMGSGVTQDVARAVSLFEQAAAAGQRDAQLKLGVLHEAGIGFQQDWQAAADWYFKAASQGQPVAQTRLGLLLAQPAGLADPLRLKVGTNSIICPDYEAAALWLRAAADQNYPPAQCLLGELVPVFFTKTTPEASRTAQWLRPAHGDSVTWYVKAAEGGMPEATLRVAQAYLSSGDYAKAYLWFMRAQREGTPGATEALVKLEPYMVSSTRLAAQKAVEEFKVSTNTAWQEGHELVHHRNPAEAPVFTRHRTNDFARLQQQATAGGAVAQFDLGLAWQHEAVWFASRMPAWKGAGHPLVPQVETGHSRTQEAMRWYALAAAKGHRDAQFHLAMLLRYPRHGASDLPQAQRWFLAAAQAGHREAQYQLALMLDEGFAGPVQPAEATRWFRQAADAGSVAAQSALQRRANVSGMTTGPARPQPPAVARLAILALEPELREEADLLLAELGKNQALQMVERTEIERVWQEQVLSTTGAKDFLKLGQLLRADGLLILETQTAEQMKRMGARLVAVGPGIVLGRAEAALPLTEPRDWARNISRQLTPFWSKLTVSQREAVPVSLLNIRAAVALPNAAGLDRELTVFLRHRLMRERELFVLERSRLEELVQEKDLAAGVDQKFWGGSYLLDGVLNRDGIKPGELSIHLRLITPGRKVTEFHRTGPADQPAQLLEELANQLLKELVQGVRHLEWNPAEEAKHYFEEAQWAYRQKMFAEAQQASEAAWALGLRSHELASLRINAYAQEAQELQSSFWGRWKEMPASAQAKLIGAQQAKLIQALAHYVQQTNHAAQAALTTDQRSAWVTMGGGLIGIAGRSFFYATSIPDESRGGLQAQLGQTRALCRDLIRWLMPQSHLMEPKTGARFLATAVEANALFHENLAAAAKQLKEMILSGVFRRSLDAGRDYNAKVKLTLWSEVPAERAAPGAAYQQVFRELLKEASPQVREDIYLWRLSETASAYEFEDNFLPFCDLLWEQREMYAQSEKLKALWTRVSSVLVANYDSNRVNPLWKRLATEELPAFETKLQPWLVKQEQRQAEARQQMLLTARQREEEEKLKRQRQVEERMKQMRAQMEENRKQSQRSRYDELVELLKTANRAVPDLFIYLTVNLTEQQAKDLKPLLAAYRERVGGDDMFRMLEQRVKWTLKEPVEKETLPKYLRGLREELPDWKSAHKPWTPALLSQPVNMTARPPSGGPPPGFAPGAFPPGFGPGALVPGASAPALVRPEKNALVLDTFWRPPVRMGAETNDMVSALRAVDVWENELLIEVLRGKSAGFGRKGYLRLRLDDMKVELITPPAEIQKELSAFGTGLTRLGSDLFGVAPNGMVRHSLVTGEWQHLPMTLPDRSVVIAVPPYLLLHNGEGFYQVDLQSKTFKILSSTRRRPAESPLDDIPKPYLSQLVSMGEGRAVLYVSQRLFLLDVGRGHWTELKAPERFNGHLKSLGDQVLFDQSSHLNLEGYVKLTGSGANYEPFLRLEARDYQVAFASPESLVMGHKREEPRWVLPVSSSQSYPALAVTQVDDSLLVLFRPLGYTVGSQRKVEDYLGQLYLCSRGLAEPVLLSPVAEGETPPIIQASMLPAISLHTTKTHVVALPEGGSGLWLIPKEQVNRAAAGARQKLREKLQQQLNADPGQPRLLRIREESKPY